MCILYLLSCRSVADFPNNNTVILWGGSSTSTSNYIYMDMSAAAAYAQMRFVRVQLHHSWCCSVTFAALLPCLLPLFFSASFLSTALPLPYSTYEHTHWRSLKYRSNLSRSLSLAPKTIVVFGEFNRRGSFNAVKPMKLDMILKNRFFYYAHRLRAIFIECLFMHTRFD